jgi:FtsP/CotA-like multicopper oxidase with cupredoxin domain
MDSRESYRDRPSPRHSDSLDSNDEVEMQEREDDFEWGQDQRLLPGEDVEAMGELEYQFEWHLRTVWVIVGSFIATALVFFGLMLFTRRFIVADTPGMGIGTYEAPGLGGFRRPASDYILDPDWNFNAPPKVREYKWSIVNRVGNPDGIYRPMLMINGLFPGPLIEANEGDTLVIEVDNQSDNATSIHFHGIYQNGTNFMDGTTGITQCPIAPSRKFRYEFTVTGQSGTYYYHGHQAVQISDGLVGPLVIHSKKEKKLQQIPYVTDRVVMLQDWYHDLSSGLLVTALEPGSESSPIPNGALMNGFNKRDCSQLPHRMCDNSTATLPSLDLTTNANHRLRFINIGAFAWFQVEVDEHLFAVTEVDGTDIVPTYNTRMMISPAQRYSMVLNTNHTNADSFWLRARMVAHCWKDPTLPGPGADEIKAVINYVPSGTTKKPKGLLSQPSSRGWNKGIAVECRDMNTTSYVPATYNPPPPSADHSYYLRANLEIGDWRLERGFFNHSTFRPNLQDPTLHRTIDGLSSHNETFMSMKGSDGVNELCYDKKNDFVIQHTGVKVVDIIIQNFDEGNHPMHLHGHKFWVLGQGHGPFPGYGPLGLKAKGQGILDGREGVLDNLIRRDVATAEGFGWLALRFVADNPGAWAFHCHMAWHSEAGLIMQFVSRVDELANWSIPEANRQLCEVDLSELKKGAAPEDSIWFGFGIGV